MSKIAYDPVKDRFAAIIRHSSLLRTLFYKLLDLFFLRSWYVRRVIRRFAEPFDRRGVWQLLDAGCGFGQYDRFLLRTFGNVRIDSIDVKEDYLEDCRIYFREEIDRDRIRFEQQDLLQVDYREAYDFVICIDVLEHIEEDVNVMINLEKALKPGGYFLMHSPSHHSEEDAGEEDSFVGEHARTGYSRKEIRSKIERAGLKPVEVRYTYGRAGHLAWVMLIKIPMILLNRLKMFALILLAPYYLVTLLPGLLLMRLDLIGENEWGTGIYALAQKRGEAEAGRQSRTTAD